MSLVILKQFVRSEELREWHTSHSSSQTERTVSLEIQVTQEILIWRTSRGLTKRRVKTKTKQTKKKGGIEAIKRQEVECQNNLAIHSKEKNGALEDKRISIDGAFERRHAIQE